MATLNSIDLGDIQNENQNKSAGLFNTPLPYSDSDESLIADLFGASKSVTISGIFVGANKTQVASFVESIESLNNGQQSGVTFQGDLLSSGITVLIDNFDWNYQKANVNSVEYTLTLKQGTPI